MNQTGTSTAAEQLLWAEIVSTLPCGSELHESAFSQLQGSAQPMKAAIAVLSALSEDLRQRSQWIFRTWATREVNVQETIARQEKEHAAQEKERAYARQEVSNFH